MTPKEQLDEIKSHSTPLYSFNIRGVTGGYIVAANVRYVDDDTGGVLASIDGEALANSISGAAELIECFADTGKFA